MLYSRLFTRLLFSYACTMQTLLFVVKCLVRRRWGLIRKWHEPYRAAHEYLRKAH